MTPVQASNSPIEIGDLTGSLLILSNYYHPELTGSAPPVTDLSLWFAQNGLKPDVIAARPSYPKNVIYEGYELGQRDREDFHGVNVRRIESYVASSRGIFGRLISEVSFSIAASARRKRRYRGVICICPSVFIVLIAPLFRAKGGRVVAIVHDIQSGLASGLKFGAIKFLIQGLRWLEATSLNRCDAIIALTSAMVDELRAIGVKVPIIIIPPQVDVIKIRPLPAMPSERAILVYSGNLGRKQGLDQILLLAKELLNRNSNCEILIRGEGSEKKILEQQVARQGLVNVSFADLAPVDDLSAALSKATLHLVPQDPGGANFALPSKIFSIMAAGRAYVATASLGSPLELVTNTSGGGICVEPNNPLIFADAVEKLLSDDIWRDALGKAGRLYVENELDREIVCRNILSVIT